MKLTVAAIVLMITTTAASATTYGKWKLYEDADEVTLETEVYISTDAIRKDSKYRHTTPFVSIGCDSMWFGDLDTLNTGRIVFRTNNMPKPDSKNGNMWQSYSGTTVDFPIYNKRQHVKFWDQHELHFQNMIRDTQLFVSFASYARANQTVTYSLSGASKALDALSEKCLAKGY